MSIRSKCRCRQRQSSQVRAEMLSMISNVAANWVRHQCGGSEVRPKTIGTHAHPEVRHDCNGAIVASAIAA